MSNVFLSPWQALRDGFLASVAIVTLSAIGTPTAVGQNDLSDTTAGVSQRPLSAVIEELAAETGTRIFFDPGLVRGKLAEGLPDTANVQQALAELLDGTGLESVEISEDRFRIVAAGTARTLDRMVVTGSRLARANALNRKRAATNIAEYAIADDVNKLPDTNLADAVSRLPGVSVQGSLGEGQFVSIRGLSPNLNQLNVNGQTSAISDVDGRQGRSGPLNVVGAGDFASIEVTKTLMPDMDAQGLGGQINVNTPSALEVGERFAFAQADYGDNDQNDQQN